MLEIKNLSVRYLSTGHKVLKNFSLKVNKGETVAILGPSGCGKTTLLNVVAGLLNEGETDIQGEINAEAKVRVVFQEPRLLPWKTVLKNASFGLEAEGVDSNESLKRAQTVLRMVGLDKYLQYYPEQLSLGMQQRVNFARALACGPDLLLLDEPFSSLDLKTKNSIQAEFKEIIKEKKMTVVFVTHDIKEANFLSDKIVTINRMKESVKAVTNEK